MIIQVIQQDGIFQGEVIYLFVPFLESSLAETQQSRVLVRASAPKK